MNYTVVIKILFLVLFFFKSNIVFTKNPEFSLNLTNRNYISSNEGYFDIVLKNTNPGQATFPYAGGEYVIILNTDFLTDHLNYVYSKDTSTYGTERIPPVFIGPLIKNIDTLKLLPGDPIFPGNEPIISATTGTLVMRIRFYNPDLYSNSCILGDQFEWKTSSPGEYTKLYYRINGQIQQINNSYSAFSTNGLCVSSFCCLEAPLPPPERLSPENNSTGLTAPVTLIWKKGFPVNYSAYLQISGDQGFSNILFDSSITAPDGTDDINIALTNLLNPGEYYWRVRQGGIPPQGAFNEPWKFTIGQSSITLNLTAIPEGYFISGNYVYELKVYLRNNVAPFELIDSNSILTSDSTYSNLLNFKNASSGSYYIVVNIPGCIETWSKSGGTYLSRESDLNEYDFSISDTQAYNKNVTYLNNKYCLYSGDANENGIVDLFDILIIYYNSINFLKNNINSDLTGDGITDLSDIIIASNNSKNFVEVRSPLINNQISFSSNKD